MSGNTVKLPESGKLQKCLYSPYDEEMPPHGYIYVSSIFEMNDNPKQIVQGGEGYVTS